MHQQTTFLAIVIFILVTGRSLGDKELQITSDNDHSEQASKNKLNQDKVNFNNRVKRRTSPWYFKSSYWNNASPEKPITEPLNEFSIGSPSFWDATFRNFIKSEDLNHWISNKYEGGLTKANEHKSDKNYVENIERRAKEEIVPAWPSRGKRPEKDLVNTNRTRREEENDLFWGNRGRRNEIEDLLGGSRGRRAEVEDPFWGNRGRRAEVEDPFWGNRGRRAEVEDPFWGNRGRRSESDEQFWGNRGKKSDTDEQFWGNRGKRNDDDDDLFWGNRGKRSETDDQFWGNRGRRSESDDLFWGNRGRRSNIEDPFWGNRGRRSESDDLFWGNRGRRSDTNDMLQEDRERRSDDDELFWGNRGRRSDMDDTFWGNRGKRTEEDDLFWGNRGRRNDDDQFWGNRGRRNEDEKPFWGNRGKRVSKYSTIKEVNQKKDEDDPFWGNRGKKSDNDPFWGNRGKRSIDKNNWHYMQTNGINSFEPSNGKQDKKLYKFLRAYMDHLNPSNPQTDDLYRDNVKAASNNLLRHRINIALQSLAQNSLYNDNIPKKMQNDKFYKLLSTFLNKNQCDPEKKQDDKVINYMMRNNCGDEFIISDEGLNFKEAPDVENDDIIIYRDNSEEIPPAPRERRDLVSFLHGVFNSYKTNRSSDKGNKDTKATGRADKLNGYLTKEKSAKSNDPGKIDQQNNFNKLKTKNMDERQKTIEPEHDITRFENINGK